MENLQGGDNCVAVGQLKPRQDVAFAHESPASLVECFPHTSVEVFVEVVSGGGGGGGYACPVNSVLKPSMSG